MALSPPRIAALMAKEFADLRAAKGVLVGPLAMLVTAVSMPVAFAVGVPAWTGEPLDAATDVVALAARLALPGAAGLTDDARVQAMLLHQFLPLMALVPVTGAMTLVTTSIVGEKQARTLEPLLATPLTSAELLVAKTGAAFVVALVALAVGCLAFGLLVGAVALPGVAATLASARVVVLLGVVAPAAALVALTLGAIVSSRARDARAAQQAGVIVVVPLVGAFLAQLNGVVTLDTTTLLGAGVGLLVVAGLLAIVAVRVFDREGILTRWT